jgi:hypothetical protein
MGTRPLRYAGVSIERALPSCKGVLIRSPLRRPAAAGKHAQHEHDVQEPPAPDAKTER